MYRISLDYTCSPHLSSVTLKSMLPMLMAHQQTSIDPDSRRGELIVQYEREIFNHINEVVELGVTSLEDWILKSELYFDVRAYRYCNGLHTLNATGMHVFDEYIDIHAYYTEANESFDRLMQGIHRLGSTSHRDKYRFDFGLPDRPSMEMFINANASQLKHNSKSNSKPNSNHKRISCDDNAVKPTLSKHSKFCNETTVLASNGTSNHFIGGKYSPTLPFPTR